MNVSAVFEFCSAPLCQERRISRKAVCAAVVALLFTGFVLRVFVAQVVVGGLDRPYQDDEVTYIRAAMNVTQGLGFADDNGRPSSYRTPGLPVLLAMLISVIGFNHIVVVRIFMCFVESLLVPACYFLGQAASGSQKIGWMAAVIAVFFPTWIIPSGAVLSDVPAAILVALIAWTAIEGHRRESLLWIAASGTILGVAVLTRPVSLAYLAGIVLWFVVAGRDWRKRFLAVVVVLISATCILAPWSIRNTIVHGMFVLVSTQGGTELYKSNNPQAIGILYIDQSHFQRTLRQRYPESQYSNEAVRSSLYQRDAVRFIFENPGRFVELCVVRFMQLWRLYSPRVPLLNSLALMATFGVALPFFVIQVARNGWRRGPDMLLVFIILCHTGVHVVFTSVVRYRVPIEPLVVVMAMEGFYAFCGRLWSSDKHT